MMQNFQGFVQAQESEEEESKTIGPEHFTIYKDFQTTNGRMGGDVFYHFLNHIFDRSENEIENHLPVYLKALIQAKVLDTKSFNKGLSKFLVGLPNIAADYPKMSEWLSKVMVTLFQEKAISFRERDIYFIENKKPQDKEEGDEPMVEDYFRVMAHFLFGLIKIDPTTYTPN